MAKPAGDLFHHPPKAERDLFAANCP
jgi:hypothetical protein